jgi:hypothetical protein
MRFFDKINSLIAELLLKANEIPNSVRLYTCYSFIDICSHMRNRMFYSFFKAMSMSGDFFEKVNFEICYNHLIEKINRQNQFDYRPQYETSSGITNNDLTKL